MGKLGHSSPRIGPDSEGRAAKEAHSEERSGDFWIQEGKHVRAI